MAFVVQLQNVYSGHLLCADCLHSSWRAFDFFSLCFCGCCCCCCCQTSRARPKYQFFVFNFLLVFAWTVSLFDARAILRNLRLFTVVGRLRFYFFVELFDKFSIVSQWKHFFFSFNVLANEWDGDSVASATAEKRINVFCFHFFFRSLPFIRFRCTQKWNDLVIGFVDCHAKHQWWNEKFYVTFFLFLSNRFQFMSHFN